MYNVCIHIVCVCVYKRERANTAKCKQLVNLGKDYMSIHFTIFSVSIGLKQNLSFPR